MTESEKQQALEFASRNSYKAYFPPKFQIELPDETTLNIKLNGYYSALVENRGGQYLFDEPTIQKIRKVIHWMKDEKKRGLLICGTLGNGKTTMLNAIRLFLENSAQMFEATTLYEHFGKTLTEKNTELKINPEKTLIIDDLGKENETYNAFGQVYHPLENILISRYRTNSTTIIATNLTFDQLSERYKERLADRMREMYVTLIYKEPSFRGR